MKILILFLDCIHCIIYILLLLAVTTFVVLAEEETPCDSIVEETLLDEEIFFDEAHAFDEEKVPAKGSIPSTRNRDFVDFYMSEMLSHKIYSREEEVKVFQRYEQAKTKKAKKAIKEEITTNNARLVFSVAKRFRGRGVDLADLIQEGNLGLEYAIDKFDYRRNNKFSTYAVNWIVQRIRRAIDNKGRNIRSPVHVLASITEMTNFERHLFHKLKREPTLEELATEMNVSVHEIEKIKKSEKQEINLSLDAPISTRQDGNDLPLMDTIKNHQASSPEDVLFKSELSEKVKNMLSILTERERTVLIMRFGVGPYHDDPHTLQEVGQRFGLTEGRIRKIQIEALEKVRDHFPEARELLKAIASQ